MVARSQHIKNISIVNVKAIRTVMQWNAFIVETRTVRHMQLSQFSC